MDYGVTWRSRILKKKCSKILSQTRGNSSQGQQLKCFHINNISRRCSNEWLFGHAHLLMVLWAPKFGVISLSYYYPCSFFLYCESGYLNVNQYIGIRVYMAKRRKWSRIYLPRVHLTRRQDCQGACVCERERGMWQPRLFIALLFY